MVSVCEFEVEFFEFVEWKKRYSCDLNRKRIIYWRKIY